MTRLRFWLACVSLCLSANAGADELKFQFTKDVAAAAKSEESLVAVTLDADVYAATQDELPDLRLQDDAGAAVPFVLRKSQEVRDQTVRRSTWVARSPMLRPLDDGGLEITLSLDKDDPQPNGLSLISPLKNFEQRVRVFTSTDGQTWVPTGPEAVIFDYSRYMDVRNVSVPFAESGTRHVRLVIDDVTAEQQSELLELTRRLRGNEEAERTEKFTIDRRPFRIDRIEFWRNETQEHAVGDRKQDYPVSSFHVSEDAKTKQTIVTVDTHREPLTSFTLATSARNFSRHCAVEIEEAHGVQKSWRTIGEATISRVDFKSFQREELTIEFSESRRTQYRIVIDNRDSTPLEVTGVKARGNMYELVFLSVANKPHHLIYGDEDAAPPNYDTAAIQTLLGERYQPEMVKLGSEQKTASASAARGFKWSSLLNNSGLLLGVIGVLVVILGYALYHAAKRMEHLPPTNNE